MVESDTGKREKKTQETEEKSYMKKFADQMVNFFVHLNQKLSALNGCSN